MRLKSFFLFFLLSFSSFVFAQNSGLEQTLSIIKPEAVAKNDIGGIIEYLEGAELQVIAIKMTQLTKERAEKFYEVHKDKAFFPELINYVSSGPVVVMVLQGKDAVAKNRQVMGATNPDKATPGTIRADFGTSITRNAVHGSDSIENAKKEIPFFFQSNEIFSRHS